MEQATGLSSSEWLTVGGGLAALDAATLTQIVPFAFNAFFAVSYRRGYDHTAMTVAAVALRTLGMWTLFRDQGLRYGPSALLGAVLFYSSNLALGWQKTYFGQEYGVVPFERVTGFPYNVGLEHPGATGYVMMVLGAAAAMMFVTFSIIPIHDTIIARFTNKEFRSRVFALKYLVGLCVGAAALPMVGWMHESMGGFQTVFLVLAGFAAIQAMIAMFLPARDHLTQADSQPEAQPAE